MPAGLCPLAYKESDDDLLSQAQCLLSLARERFTVLFGMGRGGSTLLWSSDKGVRNESWCSSQHSDCLGCCRSFDLQPTALCHAGVFYQHTRRVWKKVYGLLLHRIHTLHASQNYRIKPHGQLVRVSLTHYCASTPRLSTLWSSTTL